MTSTEEYEQEIAELAALFSAHWGLKSFQQLDMGSGVAFTGKVTFQNLVVASIHNWGNGGPNTITWLAENEADPRRTASVAQADWRSIAGEPRSLREEAAIEALLKHAGV